MRRAKCRGFTLIEVMIVVLVVGLLATLAIPGFRKARVHSLTTACLNNLRLIASAKEQWGFLGHGGDEEPAMEELHDWLKGHPHCPITGTDYIIGTIDTPPACPNRETYPTHVLIYDDWTP